MEFQEALRDFLVESSDHLKDLEKELLFLEKSPDDSESIIRLFRILHTLKGISGCFGFNQTETLVHLAEDVLEFFLHQKIPVPPGMVELFLKLADALKEILSSIECHNHEGEKTYEELKVALQIFKASLEAPADNKGEIISFSKDLSSLSSGNGARKFSVPEEFGEKLFPGEEEPQSSLSPLIPANPSSTLSSQYVHISTSLLDRLVHLAEELVLVRNEIGGLLPRSLQPTFQKLDRITSQIQEGMMKTRMQPLDRIWSTFPRLIRDRAQETGKKFALKQEGGETELDKLLIEQLREPLIHLLRNALDHGIELPEERRSLGKPDGGTIHLKAYSRGGWVYLEVSDDGKGISLEKIRESALKRKLFSSDQINSMKDDEILNLIFLAGFSTAPQVSSQSGRGVGMETVKASVEKFGGSIHLKTHPGKGTKFQIKIPLTLTILPALIVHSQGRPFAIPQTSLIELHQIGSDKFLQRVIESCGTRFYPLREELLAFSFLGQTLELGEESSHREEYNLVVLEGEGSPFGMVVDEIGEIEEIVVKPLSHHIKKISLFSGATLLGDGSLALILDAMGYSRSSNLLSREVPRKKVLETHQISNKESLLLFELEGSRKGIHLSQVLRIEEITPDQVRQKGEFPFLLHEKEMVPLINLSKYFSLSPSLDTNYTALVCSHRSCKVGFLTGEAVDIIEENLVIQRCINRRGIEGSLLWKDQIIEVIDMERIIEEVNPPLLESH